jgi:hypothetical protein
MMAIFSVIDAAQAPRRLRQSGRLATRMVEYETFVNGVKKGHVGKLSPAAGETARGVALRISRAGKRIGRSIDVWAADGAVYFKLT